MESPVKALQQRFEPESKRELYTVQFQVRHKKTDEGWADFGDALLTLAELAFPEFSSEARERLALNNYLTQLHGKPQLAMAVRQQRPKTVECCESYPGSRVVRRRGTYRN